MGKVESRSERPDFFAKGGNNGMFEKGTAHEAIPGQSGKSSNGGGSGKFAEGGSNKMFEKGHAIKMTPGQSGKPSNG